MLLWLKILNAHTERASFSVVPLKAVGMQGALSVECMLGSVFPSLLALN